MKRRENIRGSVSDTVERKILSDAKSKGISKAKWVEEACKEKIANKKAPEPQEKPKKAVSVGAISALEDLTRQIMIVKEKHNQELQLLQGKVREARNAL